MEQEYGPAVAERKRVEIRPEEIVAPRTATAGAIGAAAVGTIACVLALVGLSDVAPSWMAPISIAVIGLSMMIGGGLVAAQYAVRTIGTRHGFEEGTSASVARPYAGVWPGMVFAAGAGATGVVLGILGIVGVAPYALLPIASIVYGVAFLPGAVGLYTLNSFMPRGAGRWNTYDAFTATMGAEALIGLCGIVLGIVALSSFNPIALTLVATFILGFGMLAGGAILATRLIGYARG